MRTSLPSYEDVFVSMNGSWLPFIKICRCIKLQISAYHYDTKLDCMWQVWIPTWTGCVILQFDYFIDHEYWRHDECVWLHYSCSSNTTLNTMVRGKRFKIVTEWANEDQSDVFLFLCEEGCWTPRSTPALRRSSLGTRGSCHELTPDGRW